MESASQLQRLDRGEEPTVRDSDTTALLGQAARIAVANGREAIAHTLQDLSERLTTGRLQLAIVGQFKRGKSTLLNALIGADALPTGVLPVTAIPTFIAHGDAIQLRAEFVDGRCDVSSPATLASLRAALADLVTEERNPKNVLGVTSVRVCLPSTLLARGIVLIDTPGIGSTLRHNTAAAETALPACDAGLFVVSADPPITDAELEYLGRVRENAAHLLVVLNKADLLSEAELEQAQAFLRQVLVEQAGLARPEIFPLSARRALAAREAHDAGALEASGFARLETRLDELIATERQAILRDAIARKASAIVRTLAFELGVERRALELPLADLEERRATFGEAIVRFEAERQLVADLLVADQKRSLEGVEDDAARLRQRFTDEICAELDANPAGPAAAWAAIRPALAGRFEIEFGNAADKMRRDLEATFNRHMARVSELLELVRRTAAEIMDLPFEPSRETLEFQTRFLPHWAIERPEALNPLPPGAGERLLPPSLRRKAERRRITHELDDVVRRNVESLRWAVRQNVQDTFRRFASEMNTLFDASLAATRGVMDAAVARRRHREQESAQQLQVLEAANLRLREIAGQLDGREA